MQTSTRRFRDLALLLFASCLSLPATVGNDGMTAEVLLGLRTVREVALSPTGETVAYVLSVPRDADEEKGRNLVDRVTDHAGKFNDALAALFNQPISGQPMEDTARLLEYTLVGHIAQQGVFEDVE